MIPKSLFISGMKRTLHQGTDSAMLRQIIRTCYPGITLARTTRHFSSKQEIVGENKSSSSIASSEYFAKKLNEEDLRNKETFANTLDLYNRRNTKKRGVIEFIESALGHMESYGVHKDLEVYKSIIDIMPKGKYIPENMIQSAFHHYAKHQDCITKVLQQMENNNVIPDEEVGDMIKNIFSIYSNPMRKFARMVYWMPKFKNASPWPLPFDLPKDNVELAKLAIERITSVDRYTKVSVYDAQEIPESIDKTWIVSGMSDAQRSIISELPKNKALFVEGGFRVWLQKVQITYFILRGEPVQRFKPSGDSDDVKSDFKLWMHGEKDLTIPEKPLGVHEQEDGTILGVCATGTSSKDSLLSWIRFLQRENPEIENIPILFTLSSPLGPVIPIDTESKGVHQT